MKYTIILTTEQQSDNGSDFHEHPLFDVYLPPCWLAVSIDTVIFDFASHRKQTISVPWNYFKDVGTNILSKIHFFDDEIATFLYTPLCFFSSSVHLRLGNVAGVSFLVQGPTADDAAFIATVSVDSKEAGFFTRASLLPKIMVHLFLRVFISANLILI
jgi:hypothetical protein